MSDRLTLTQILLLAAYAAGMSGGQLLFKSAALRYGAAGGDRSGLLQTSISSWPCCYTQAYRCSGSGC